MADFQTLRSLAAEADLTTAEAVERLRAGGIAAHKGSRYSGRTRALARRALGLERPDAGRVMGEEELVVQILRPLRVKGKVARDRTTDFTHTWRRGIPPHQRDEARRLAERMIVDGLLLEKQSQGRRHVWLSRAGLERLAES